jgi:hypothetical protein
MGPGKFLSVMAVMAGAATLGCIVSTPVTYSAINSPPRAFARRDPANVDVFVGKAPVRPSLDVGLFEVYRGVQSGTGPRTEAMIATLRVHAALRGCDAVQILGVELVGKTREPVVRGVCEVYTDAQAQAAASQIAVPKPLPGEGASCGVDPRSGSAAPVCPDPLVCSSNVCASPYR